MDVKELRIGNTAQIYLGTDDNGAQYQTHRVNAFDLINEVKDLEPIKLTEKIVIDLGFVKIPHFTVLNSLMFDLGRNRHLLIGCIGTPNEMLFLTSQKDDSEKIITDLICLHNWDYDGALYLHKLENIIIDLKYEKAP